MSSDYNAVQESIKIALDAADAATDVTSEYNRVKREHKKLEAGVKSIHRYTSIIFASSMVAAIAALVFAALIYFRTLSDLTTMTTTSREALIVFAENVDNMNSSLEKLQSALDTQQQLVALNSKMIDEMDLLRGTITQSNEGLAAALSASAEKMASSNAEMGNALSAGIAAELGSQTKKMTGEVAKLARTNSTALKSLSDNMANNKSLSQLIAAQNRVLQHLEGIAAQNQTILTQFKTQDNRISFP
jgi:hypothetical protein